MFFALPFACCTGESVQKVKPQVTKLSSPRQPARNGLKLTHAFPSASRQGSLPIAEVPHGDGSRASVPSRREERPLYPSFDEFDEFDDLESPATELMLRACAMGDLKEVRRLLDGPVGADLPALDTIRDSRGMGLLHFACAGGNLNIVRLLCEGAKKLDPNEYTPGCVLDSPVLLAARYGHYCVVQYLADDHQALAAPMAPSGWAEWNSLLPEPKVSVSGQLATVAEPMLLPLFKLGLDSGENDAPAKKPNAVEVSPQQAAERRLAVRQLIRQRCFLKKKLYFEDVESSALSAISGRSTASGGSRRSEDSAEPGTLHRLTLREMRGMKLLAVDTSDAVCCPPKAAKPPTPLRRCSRHTSTSRGKELLKKPMPLLNSKAKMV